MQQADVALVAMPWAKLQHPSIQLGLLTALLEDAHVKVNPFSLYLDFMQHLLNLGSGITTAHYDEVAARYFIGDWIFSIPPFTPDVDDGGEYLDFLQKKGTGEELLRATQVMRGAARSFAAAAVDGILASRPRIVGFTTTFGQNVPSLLVAKMLKNADPELRIVFGGANCDGPMGRALLEAFDWVDYVVRGEAESLVVPLITDLIAGAAVRSQPGLCFRIDGRPAAVDTDAATPPQMDGIPTPVYEEYFERLTRTDFFSDIAHEISIPFETSRGCWWGAKSHCTFCGLNGTSMTYRSKSPSRAIEELLFLARRHQQLSFHAIDNILDYRYFQTFIASLPDQGFDFRLFYEMKVNVAKEQLRRLREAGVTAVQPGLESLSTPILKLMRKGSTAFQNIRLLKWAAELGIEVYWNIIYGFPGEPPEEYERMAALVPALSHLRPPSLVPLALERFSPYFEHPEEYGLRITGPSPHYRFAYPLDDQRLHALAYSFQYDYEDGRRPDCYVEPLRLAVDSWQSLYPHRFRALSYRRGPGFLLIDDQRPGFGPARYSLGEREAMIYTACDAGATPKRVAESAPKEMSVTVRETEEFLREMAEAGLVYEERGIYLSLALAAHEFRDAQPAG